MEYKGYIIDSDPTYGLKFLRFSGKGSLPLELRSDYLSTTTAMRAIDLYLYKKENKHGEVHISG